MDFSLILNQMVVLFVLLFIGYIAKKKDILDDHTAGKMTSFVVNIAIPCLIISTMIKSSSATGASVSSILMISILYYASMFILAVTIPRLLNVEEGSKGVYSFMLMFSNIGFMGIPVVNAIWGSDGVFTAIIFNLLYNTLVFTIGVRFISGDKGGKLNIGSFINLPIMSNFVGLFIYFTSIQIPDVVTLSLNTVGSMTTPLALVIIGVSLAKVNFMNILTNKMLFFYSGFKQLLIPLMVYLILSLFNFTGVMIGTIVVLTGMPIGATTVILAKEHGSDEKLAAEGVFISTLLSIFTIPFVAYGLSQIG